MEEHQRLGRLGDRRGRVWAALVVGVLGGGLGTFVVSGDLRLHPSSRGWREVTSGLQITGDGSAFAAGERVGLRFGPVAATGARLVLSLSRRRAANPVRLVVSRDGVPFGRVEPADQPLPTSVPFGVGRRTVEVRIDADPARDGFATLYRIHEILLDRAAAFATRLAGLLPGLLGWAVVVLVWPRTSRALAVLWGVHVAGLAVALLLLWDGTILLRFSRTLRQAAGWAGLASLTALVLVPRLDRRPASAAGEPAGRFRPAAVIRAASILAALGFLGLGLILGRPAVLTRLFPELRLDDPDVIARIGAARTYFFVAAYLVGVLGLLATTFRRASRLSERAAGAICSVLIGLFLLTGLEAVVATRYAPVYLSTDPNLQARAQGALVLSDPFLGHALNPDTRLAKYHVNRAGFRGPEVTAKEPGEVRVVAIGDSITFGLSVREDQTFPSKLQTLLEALDRPDRSYRVINAGVPAYTSLQVLRALERRVLGLHPDLIVVTVGWNDFYWSLDPAWYAEKPVVERGRPRRFKPALVRMVEEIAARRRVGDRRPHPGALLAFRENLEAILATAAGNRIGVVVTNLPTILSTRGNTPEELTKATGVILPRIEHLAMFQGVIDDVCRAHPEIACVTDVFALGETGKGAFFFDDCHPLPEGYAVMARRVFDVLVARPDLLSRTSPTSGRLQ